MARRKRQRVPSNDQKKAAASRRAKRNYAILMGVVSIAPIAFLGRGAYRAFVTHERVEIPLALLLLALLILAEAVRAVFVLRS